MLLLTGYQSLPQTSLFWEKENDIGLCIVYKAMSSKEFEDLKSFINFADNNALDTSDKFAKVRSLYEQKRDAISFISYFLLHLRTNDIIHWEE